MNAVGIVVGNEDPDWCLLERDLPAQLEPLDGGSRGQLVDADDADAAQAEPVEDGRAGRRHCEHRADRDGENGQRDRDGAPPATRPLETAAHRRGDVGRRRKLDLPAELPQGDVELSHTTPSDARAHERCAT